MLSIENTFVETGGELVVKSTQHQKTTHSALLTLYSPEGNPVAKVSGGGENNLRFSLESVSPGVYTAEVKVPAIEETAAAFLMVALAGSSQRVARFSSAIQIHAKTDDPEIAHREAILRKVQAEYRSLGLSDLVDDAAIDFDRPCPPDEGEPPVTPTL
jgi:hypothetical protein